MPSKFQRILQLIPIDIAVPCRLTISTICQAVCHNWWWPWGFFKKCTYFILCFLYTWWKEMQHFIIIFQPLRPFCEWNPGCIAIRKVNVMLCQDRKNNLFELNCIEYLIIFVGWGKIFDQIVFYAQVEQAVPEIRVNCSVITVIFFFWNNSAVSMRSRRDADIFPLTIKRQIARKSSEYIPYAIAISHQWLFLGINNSFPLLFPLDARFFPEMT